MKTQSLLVLAFVSTLGVACGGDQKQPPAAPSGGTEASTATPSPSADEGKKAGDDPSQSQINISDEIKKACGLTDADAFFAFDSARIRPQDRKVLGALAKCFNDGALKGRTMALVGHADPRGESEYNMVLGQQRADNVKKYIGAEGLAAERMQTTSRGAMDATGTDEASWARDRRVDVNLAD